MNGAWMATEMAEQPARLRQLSGRCDDVVERVRAVAPAPLNGITIVARGSSDNAAVYGRYLLAPAIGKPISPAAPSLHTLYGIDVDYSGRPRPWDASRSRASSWSQCPTGCRRCSMTPPPLSPRLNASPALRS